MSAVQYAASCADQTLGRLLSGLLSHRHRSQHAALKLPGLTNGAEKQPPKSSFLRKERFSRRRGIG